MTSMEWSVSRAATSLVLSAAYATLSWIFSHIPNPASETFVMVLGFLCAEATYLLALLCLCAAGMAVLIGVWESLRVPSP